MEKQHVDEDIKTLRETAQFVGHKLSIAFNLLFAVILLAAITVVAILINEHGVGPFQEFYAMSQEFWIPYFEALEKS